MRVYTREELRKIRYAYNGDHDLGPDAPVTWREHALLLAVEDLQEQIEELEAKVSRLLDAVPSAAQRD